MERESIVDALHQLRDEKGILIVEEGADSIWIYDLQDGKDIVYYLTDDVHSLSRRIHISERIPIAYRPNLAKTAQYIINNLPRDVLWTLKEINFVWDEKDYYEMVDRQEEGQQPHA